MDDADFAIEFKRLKSGAEALAAVAAQSPELAAQFAAVLDSAPSDAEAAAELAQAQAQANAIRALNEQVRQTLLTAAASVTPPEPAREPEQGS